MPQQEIFFEKNTGDRRVEVLKTYDQKYAHEAFGGMDEAAQTYLWNSLGIDESYSPAGSEDVLWDELLDAAREDGNLLSFFVVNEAHGGKPKSLYVSPDWPSAEAFANRRIESNTIEAKTFECPNTQCGAVFLYRRISCGHFVAPDFCPICGGLMTPSEGAE
jgi:predicted RNA-binding Zn-ribbon protein involved in translation (DUF1610 family)